jgi:hypothetical protein
MIDFSNMKLGKLEPKFKPTDFKMVKYLLPKKLPVIPQECSWDKAVKKFQMYKNDQIGDCTCAAAGHRITLTHYNTGRPFDPPESDIVKTYSNLTGYNGDEATDSGAYLSDVLSYWRKNGIAQNYITAYMKVNSRSATMIKTAIYLFGGAYVGLMLPISCQNQKIWDITDASLTGDAEPNSWGGHCVVLSGYNKNGIYNCITWGSVIQVTEKFLMAYLDETWAVLAKGWIKDDSKSPSGFKFSELMEDINKLA